MDINLIFTLLFRLRILLNQFKWDKTMLMDRYFNLQNHDNVLKDLANIVSSISDFVTEENSPITER